MLYLLNPRVLIALAIVAALAFSHLMAYRKGSANVKAEWTLSVANANAEARQLERARQRFADEAGRMAATREARLRADAARAADSARGLRDELTRISGRSEPGTASDATVRTLGDILQACTDEYRSVAEQADAAFSEVKMLRDAWPK